MADPKSIAALIAVALATSGCDLADRLEGKSPGREHMERLAATPATEEPEVATLLDVSPEPVCSRDENGVLSCS